MMRMVTLFLLLLGSGLAIVAQETDKHKEQMPKLEIPEITIVGKKAITLPFARKGELFNVNLYEAPPPDTSLLGSVPVIPLKIGSLPRYVESRSLWRGALEGGYGSFSSGMLDGLVNYRTNDWGIDARAGFSTTRGHILNAERRRFHAEVGGNSLIRTDNDVLRTLRVSGDVMLGRDIFNLFGRMNDVPERRRSEFGFAARLGSLDEVDNTLAIGVSASTIDITDRQPAGDSGASTVSPRIDAALTAAIGETQLLTSLSYRGSSLNYSVAAASPSMVDLSAALRVRPSSNLFLTAGGMFAQGTGTAGDRRSLISPSVSVRWELSPDREITFWWRPEFSLATYTELMNEIPYLEREIALRPERKPINAGASVFYNHGLFSIELHASFSRSSNRSLTVADSGRINLEYAEVDDGRISLGGTMTATPALTLSGNGSLHYATERGKNKQIPMVPLATLTGRMDLMFSTPLSAWSVIEYRGPRKTDRLGTNELPGLVLFSAGISTDIIPRSTSSLEFRNLLNTSYEWWRGYRAPGREILLNVKVHLR